jgi:lipopolysaccharide export system protein LptA
MADRAWRLRTTGAVLAACLLFACAYSPARAGEAVGNAKTETKKKPQTGGPGSSKQNPILITSDRMEVDRQKNMLIYQGQVVAIQGDMTMRSDKLTTYFDPDLQQIKEAIAEGKLVQITQGDRVATGTKAVFDGVTQTMTMTGNPMMRQGNSQVSGEKIIYFMTEDRMIVESGKDRRVEGTIFPEELQQKKGDTEPTKAK